MTSVSSYRLLQCTDCGQKHIFPVYGTLNFSTAVGAVRPIPSDLMVCQRCSIQRPLKHFIHLKMLLKPRRDATPKWLRSIRKIFDRAYKEPEQHPMRLYPKLNSAPFDPEKYRSGMAKDYMEMYGAYPAWFIGLASLKKNGG